MERADHHINQFDAIVRRYVMANVKSLRPKRNNRRPRIIGGHLPKHTSTIVGDAIHNIRTSLDHAYCALVTANGNTISRYTTFPFHKDRMSAKASLEGHIKSGLAPSADVINLILDVIQPFEDAGNDFYGIHALDIADKHHSLIPSDMVMGIDQFTLYDAAGSKKHSISGMSLVIPDGYEKGIMRVDGGDVAKLEGDPRAAFDICFGQGEFFERQSIIGTLQRLRELVRDTLIALARL